MREAPPALGWTVLGLVFLDELLLVAAVWVAATARGGWVAGLLAAGAVVGLWSVLASPKAPFGGPVTRPLTKALVIITACGGLWWTGEHRTALALLIFSTAINALAQTPSIARLPDHSRR